ncbi:hypothetical protein AB395_0000769 [Sinorhizobium fredii CCBAU 45436]|nr:hypothetical protein SF83666_c07370 [Sinorhizobium fredii CCBAU 83666]AWI56446.1 hypothetical protein AB395_0000769 [Sinorhizobium fredii CCBAU 45436]AWM24241.1 hypothetical protein AOX55_0000965 [Sinorhizobium fredii CCBAU 25509]
MRFCLFFHAQFFLVILPRNRIYMFTGLLRFKRLSEPVPLRQCSKPFPRRGQPGAPR